MVPNFFKYKKSTIENLNNHYWKLDFTCSRVSVGIKHATVGQAVQTER